MMLKKVDLVEDISGEDFKKTTTPPKYLWLYATCQNNGLRLPNGTGHTLKKLLAPKK